jgi:hypothetical protein
MNVTSKIGLLVLVAVLCLAAREYVLLTQEPAELTELTLRQLDNSDAAAEALRVADASKNWLLAGWPFLVVGLLAAYLFWDDAARLHERRRGPAAPS